MEYVYQYKDHLGNIRLSYTDVDKNGIIDPNTEIVEESNYYPFGLKHKGYNNVTSSIGNSTAQKFGFGGKENNEELGLEWHDFHARNYDASLGRWMNLDPHSYNYYDSSPYNYALNNPLFFVDPDGMDNITYLVLLKSADREQMDKLVNTVNQLFQDLGLENRVQIYEGEEMFDSKNLDSTDSFGVVGSTEEITELFDNHGDNFKGISNINRNDLNDRNTFELADRSNKDGSGTGFLIKTENLSSGAKEFGTTEVSFAAFTTLHALGHNADEGHLATDQALMSSGGLLGNTINGGYYVAKDGGRITGKVKGVSSFNDVFNPNLNSKYIKSMKARFGNNKASDNYKSNKKRNNTIDKLMNPFKY